MEAASNVTTLFSMDEKRMSEYAFRLQKMDGEAERLRDLLNSPAALESAGLRWMFLGLVILASVVAGGVALSGEYKNTWFLVACAGSVGIWVISRGGREWLIGRDIRRRARKAQRRLEGRDGFLWSFETALTGWDNDLPEPVAESLRETCQASKDGALADNQYGLRAYWYWVSALNGRIGRLREVGDP